MVAGRHRSYANTQVTREATSSNMFVHAVRWFSWKSAGCAAVHHVENYLVNLGGWLWDIVGVTATSKPKTPKRAATNQTNNSIAPPASVGELVSCLGRVLLLVSQTRILIGSKKGREREAVTDRSWWLSHCFGDKWPIGGRRPIASSCDRFVS